MIEMSVVLPAPLGPSNPTNSPSATDKSIPASACTLPKRRAMSTTSTAAVIERYNLRFQQLFDAVDDRERLQAFGQRSQRERAPLRGRTSFERNHHRERSGISLQQAAKIDDALRRRRQRFGVFEHARRIVHRE